MKIKILALIAFVVIALSACDLSGDSNATPSFMFYSAPFTTSGDTLSMKYTDDSGVYKLDTISVGDTVVFQILMYGYNNNLTKFYLKQSSDTTSARIILPTTTSLDSVFTSDSNYANGNFYFKSNITQSYFPFKYVAKSVTNDIKLTFYLESDANFGGTMSGSNSTTFVIKTPIKAKVESNVEIKRKD